MNGHNFSQNEINTDISHISVQTKRRALECYIEPILMYGCEALTILKQIKKKLKATEMWFLQRMLPISWTTKIKRNSVRRKWHT